MIDEKMLGKGAVDTAADFQKPDARNHAEISAVFAPAQWKEKKTFVTYPKRNQGVTSACTTYAQGKLLSIDELSENGKWRELSPRGLYPFVVVPGGGANSLFVAKMAAKIGMTLDHLFPSDGLSENEMASSEGLTLDAKQVGLIYKSGEPVECASDFETIASIIEGYRNQGKDKGVSITIMGKNNGKWLTPFPVPPESENGVWRHRVVVTDFGLIAGKKYLAIDNSWGTEIGVSGQQFIGEDYMPFMYGALYTLNIPDDWMRSNAQQVPKVKYVWKADLEVGSRGPDVLALQQALQALGMFPVSSVVGTTGNFGGITKQAVILFQQSFLIPATGKVGPLTRAKLNSLFN